MSMIPSTTPEHVIPDAIFQDGEKIVDHLNPCPACGAMQEDAPEGIHDHQSAKHSPGAVVGEPRWNFEHCFKCGYRPGLNNVLSVQELNRQFTQFKAWLLAQNDNNHPSLNPAAQNADYQAQISDLKAQIEALQGASPTANQLGGGNVSQ